MDRVLVDAACRRTAYRVRILEQGGIDGRPLENPQHISVQQGMLVFIKAFRATGMRTQRGCSRPHPTAYQPPDGQHSGKAVEVNRTGEPGAAVRGRPTPSRHAARMMMLGMLDRDWAVSSSASPRCS